MSAVSSQLQGCVAGSPVHLHLVSMPFAYVLSPSLQLGSLKAYVDHIFSQNASFKSTSYSAFFDVFRQVVPEIPKMVGVYTGLAWHCENFYYLLFLRQFFSSAGWESSEIPFAELIERCNAHKCSSRGKTEQKTLLNTELLETWNQATLCFLKDRLLAGLSRDAINIIGLSAQFWQVFSSFYCVRFLQQYQEQYPMVFVFGGASTSDPSFQILAKKYQIPGIAIVGEGETQLAKIISRAMDISEVDEVTQRSLVQDLPRAVILSDVGIHENEMPPVPQLGAGDQISNLDELPYPDFSEYFETLKMLSLEPKLLSQFLAQNFYYPIEASRGCSYGHCNFCNYNRMWLGFRQKSTQRILSELDYFHQMTSMEQAIFTDNLADNWITDVCRSVLHQNRTLPIGVEIRASRNEALWVEMALSGVKIAFVGTEALSDNLLRKMKKGNTVINNLCSHKYAIEMGMQFLSNLILNHPESTIEDILETIRVLSVIPHFNPYLYNRYLLCTGSRDYAEMDPSISHRLMNDAMAFYLMNFEARIPLQSLSIDFQHPDSSVAEAWDRFEQWYEKVAGNLRKKRPRLSIENFADGVLRIVDTRFGDFKTLWFYPPHSWVLDCCHEPQRLAYLVQKLGLSPEQLSQITGELLEKKLLLCVGDHYLTLALRSRNVLIRQYYQNHGISQNIDTAAKISQSAITC